MRARIREMELDGRLLQKPTPETRQKLETVIRQTLADHQISLPLLEAETFYQRVLSTLVGFGRLQPLLDDPDITEVMVNGPNSPVWIERDGRLLTTDVFLSEQEILLLIDRIVQPINRRVDQFNPYVDARLPDGSRVNIAVPPIAIRGPYLTIRKFRPALTMEKLIRFGSLPEDVVPFLASAVEARLSILVSGGTGSGKTSFLNALAAFIPPDERIITIEDAAELQLQQPHVVPFESKMANIQGLGEVTIRDLVRNALRMRPDRIVVGEVRGKEALDLIKALNTGHEGSLGTIHANSPADTISRLETLAMEAGEGLSSQVLRDQIFGGVHMIVFLKRFPDGRRRVTQITELTAIKDHQIFLGDIYRYRHETDRLERTEHVPERLLELARSFGKELRL
ncbi:MAG: CpaF family protein [Clostridiales bacterium]|nr:CpaF family protein [Clostridiales bacterium]